MATTYKYVKQPANLKGSQWKLVWNPGFSTKWDTRYGKAQVFIDSEVLRRCEPYVPFKSGTLRNSGPLHTVIGSGKVKWVTPYARPQYYRKRKTVGSRTGALRGPYWFARMKAVHKKSIISGAKKVMGG